MAQPKEILIVDDEVGIRELLSEILQDEGYRVSLAENAGQEIVANPGSSSSASCACCSASSSRWRSNAIEAMSSARCVVFADNRNARRMLSDGTYAWEKPGRASKDCQARFLKR